MKRSGGIESPRPPRFKQDGIPITYMQMGIVHERDTEKVRLSLPKALKKYMEGTYQIHENFLFLENKIFRDMDQIKQLRIVRQEESYTSQCSPLSPEVGRKYAEPCKRKQRGLFRDKMCIRDSHQDGSGLVLMDGIIIIFDLAADDLGYFFRF